MDHHLQTIGEVTCHVQCVRPFEGAQLEIGGRVETYWKSTTTAPSGLASQDHAHQFQPHRPLSISTSSPSMRSVMHASNPRSQSKDPKESGFITASSLSGDYLHLVVQVTTDYKPVVFFDQHLPYSGLTIGASEVTLEQFIALAENQRKAAKYTLNQVSKSATTSEWYKAIRSGLCSLEEVLAVSVPSCLLLLHDSDLIFPPRCCRCTLAPILKFGIKARQPPNGMAPCEYWS